MSKKAFSNNDYHAVLNWIDDELTQKSQSKYKYCLLEKPYVSIVRYDPLSKTLLSGIRNGIRNGNNTVDCGSITGETLKAYFYKLKQLSCYDALVVGDYYGNDEEVWLNNAVKLSFELLLIKANLELC